MSLYIENPNIMSLGKHIFIDIENCFIENENLNNMANKIFELMKRAINENSKMKIVHSHIKIFDDETTPNGWTSVLLLDASHMTSHCYSDQGIMAFDLFTCGDNNPSKMIEKFIENITTIFSKIKIKRVIINNRF